MLRGFRFGDRGQDEICEPFYLTLLGCGLASPADREQASHASSARAGRSRQCQPKWGDPRVGVHQNGAGNSAVPVAGGGATLKPLGNPNARCRLNSVHRAKNLLGSLLMLSADRPATRLATRL